MSRLEKLREFERLLDELALTLEEAAKTYRTENLDDLERNYPREGVVAALMAVQAYLRAAGIRHTDRDPIRAVVGALGDAEEGRHNKLLAVAKSDGRDPIGNEISAYRGHAVAIVTLLKNQGMKVRDAARKVASALDREGFQFTAREDRNQTKALINLRKSLMAGRGANEVSRAVYRAVVDCDQYGPDTAERLLDELVAKVRKVSKPPEI
jgi:peptidoglycan/xylan/chitin deacetylase (PgdA/CDA1 family)